ncbi:MAG: T9SS type A sorting domain-containing protein [Chitinophagaceae bacterium]|nr:T9SS type A sorting domain-containing protein [Chitinophagaceae bacterium]
MKSIFTNQWIVKKTALILITGLMLLLSNSVMSQATPADPTSNSPQCASPGVTMNFTGTAPAGETWYWQSSATGTSTANAASSLVATVSGTYYVRAQDDVLLTWSAGAGSVTVIVTPDINAPVFVLGATSTRCQGAGNVMYSATSAGSTSITYSLDAATSSFGNTINVTTGEVTYLFNWNGTSTITATADGCGGPLTADHEVTITPTVGTPVFVLGATSTRCQGAGIVNYSASATNSTSITYSLDAVSEVAGNSINSATGDVTYIAGWSGTSLITAEAAGCNGPKSASHTVTVNATVQTPVFTLGATSTRCKSGTAVTYSATAANSTSITYTLDAASILAGLSINASTGAVNYNGGWVGTSVITATAAGCSGPVSATHSATTNDNVQDPVFVMGSTSTRCLGAGSVTYTANAAFSTSISYSLNAAAVTGGNSINASTGEVTYVAGWTGSTIITATAAGCNGPRSATHSVTITPAVGTPVFVMGSTSTRCKGGGSVTYTATATNATSITYSLDPASAAAPLNIDPNTGTVTYYGYWSGPTTIITATANGCNGPVSSTHTVTITPTIGSPVFSAGSTSTRCQGAGVVNYGATATNTTAITYSLNAAATTGGNTINATTGDVTYVAGWAGSTIITATATGCGGPTTSTHTVTITPTVGTPVFTGGATSSRCIGAGTTTYSATATNNTGITYTLDGASSTGGNSINPATGAVTFDAAWLGSTTITATATGCNGPKTATHVVTTNDNVQTPVFGLGSSSTRCWGAATLTYTATAANNTGITYSLDATSLAYGNTINASTGAVTYWWLWFGTSTITATATGCSGPKTATHTVTIIGGVGNPVFTLGSTSTRCQGVGNITYDATANNSSSLTYSLDAASLSGGNTINAATGEVTYVATWSGTTTITASATGCGGPKTSNHTVTVTPTVGTPVFTLGATSTRCQGAGTVTYTATASNSTSRTYSLDGTTLAFPGNSFNTSTGALTYAASWSGTSTITVTAAGCNGPSTAMHTITITPTVGTPVFNAGATSVRCQGTGTVLYDATASTTTGITYTQNAASASGGNLINASTGLVTYAAGWSGTTIITASAAGCNGPKTATHTVTITPTVGTPVFVLGATSTRCQGANTVTYTANATNNTGITYSLDASSIAAGNSINATTGAVTYWTGWTGTSIITATATGCNGPKTANHTVTITPTVSTPVFTLGATSVRCQGGAFVTYTATAANSTSITYSLDAGSTTGGCTINAITGVVVYVAGWSGTTIITASATGCNGPSTAVHTVTVTPTVGTPVFTLGATSTRCQGANSVTYTATATNATGITYTLDGTSTSAGNSINATTGAVSFAAAWNGTSTITATAAGCNGPNTASHVVTITPTVGTPVFSLGLQSVRTQGAGTITYSATATNNTGISYSLDAASIAAGNTINTATGSVTWIAGWFGLSSITASANGCNGPSTQSHIVNINPSVVQTPLYLSGPGQYLDRIDPVATNITTTEVSYPISSAAAGIAIDASSTTSGITTPVTRSHTTGTGANRFMLVGISQKNRTVLSVTYGGSPLTLVGDNNLNGNARISLYQMVNPPSGTANVVVNFSSDPDKGAVVNVTTYTGVNQSNPLGTFVSDQAKTTTPTVNVNSATGELIYDVVSVRTSTISVGSGQTERWNVNTGQEIYGAGSTKNGLASTTMSWTNNAGSADWALGAVPIKPAASVNTITYTQNPILCSDLTIKAQTIQMLLHVKVTSGTMPVNPAITAQLKYGSTNIITLSNPVYNSGSKILSWTGTLGADVTVPNGQALALAITSAQAGVQFQIEYHSNTKPSRISLLPVSTFIDFESFDVFDAPYPGGTKRISGLVNTTYYARAKITTPFGYQDITGMDIKINPPGTTVPVNCIDSSTCTRTYEYPWATSGSTGMYYLLGTAKEGYENLIKNSDILAFDVCAVCPPVALNDSATGAGGAPFVVDVLANDYDPNNNMKPSTLSINTQPNNGTGFISNGKVIYLPNGSFAGRDTLVYQICDSTNACATAYVFFTVNPLIVDPCSEATKTHTYYLPFGEDKARIALANSANVALPSNNIRTVISMKMPYPGMTIVWDHWEDGYEINPLDPLQSTTQVWGDGNPYNGIAPGYANDIIPAGGSIVLDNTMPTNPRVAANIFYDGADKITASGQIAVTQVCGEPSIMQVQCMKTNVSPVKDYGTFYTIPVGQNYPSRDFQYTALFIRAAQNNTVVEIDKDNNGTLETTATINEGETYFVDGAVLSGASIASSGNIGVELHFGGVDGYSSRDVPIFPATWYSNTYYSPVPTTGRTTTTPRDTAAVMLYNSLQNRPLTINWTSGVPSSGSITIPAKSVVRFPLAYSQTAGYKFVNPTGESFTAIQICDSYTPGGGGNGGTEYDWSFNLISQNRLTDFATVAWAPGSIDGSRNDNPVWVTPINNTTIYVKYDGNISGTQGLLSPCGMRYDVSYTLNALNHKRVIDPTDNDQSGLAVYTCDGTKLAAVYGEDPSTAVTANPSWDVGSTIQPFCKQKLIFANDDYGRTMVNQPVTLPILLNDFGFLAVVDPGSVSTIGLLQPKNGTVTVNPNGTVIYLPNPGFTGKDTFEYNVCSTPTPIVCDKATVYVDIAICPAPYTQNVVAGQVFLDKNDDGIYNDGGTGVPGAKVYLYVDGNCNQVIDANELKDSVITDSSGSYQFISYPEKFVLDDFDDASGNRTCANGSDGNAAWLTDWTDIGDNSTGFCNTSQNQANTDAEVYKDGAFTNALRLKDNNVSATRSVNLSGASYAFLSFSYRRKSATLTAGEDVIVQASSNGTTFGTVFTIAGDGTADAGYVNIYNQDITAYASANTRIRFLTNNNVDDQDTVYIDNVKVQFIRYPICYITRLDPASVPPYHHTTTILQNTLTAVSAQTCFGPFYYCIAKNKISISGTLFNDANGLTDNLVNGTAIGNIGGATVYAYLVDSTNTVVRRITVNAGTGTYTFTDADMFTNYTLRLSTLSVNLGDPPPADAGMSLVSGNWVTTGDAYGTNNAAGSGNKAGAATCDIAVRTSWLNVTNVNFGVERLPDSDDRTINYPRNDPNIQYDVTGGLTGSDPEDGILGAGKTYKITQLPFGAVLYYNGLAVSLNQVITSFNAALLKIDPDDDTHQAIFRYASRDAAGLFDPTPAQIVVNWARTVPVKLISFSGRLNGLKVDLNWVTASELDTKHFEVQRSADGLNFSTIATVAAKGTSTNVTNYDQVDLNPYKGVNYYRLKIVDIDGKFEYSQIVIIRIDNNVQLVTKVAPNPFTGKIDVYLTLTHNTPVDFRFIDINGRIVFKKSVAGLKGFNWFTINDLDRLPAAPYMLHIVTDDATIVEKLMKQ